jgi:hypothetical protein
MATIANQNRAPFAFLVIAPPDAQGREGHRVQEAFESALSHLQERTECLLRQSPEYPVADFFEPASYDWTTEHFEVRRALKRFNEQSNADH